MIKIIKLDPLKYDPEWRRQDFEKQVEEGLLLAVTEKELEAWATQIRKVTREEFDAKLAKKADKAELPKSQLEVKPEININAKGLFAEILQVIKNRKK